MEYRSEYNSPVGKLILWADENALKGLWIENQKYFEEGVEGKALPGKDSPVIKQAEQWLNRYFAGGSRHRTSCLCTRKEAASARRSGNFYAKSLWGKPQPMELWRRK